MPEPWQDLRSLAERIGRLEVDMASLRTAFNAHDDTCNDRDDRLAAWMAKVDRSMGDMQETIKTQSDRLPNLIQRLQWWVIGGLVAAILAILSRNTIHWPWP